LTVHFDGASVYCLQPLPAAVDVRQGRTCRRPGPSKENLRALCTASRTLRTHLRLVRR
jgi:hypothetical protein